MGKIVKFCTACDEGFAEKFAFCPNCGAGLQAFEMNPVEASAASIERPEPSVPESIARVIEPTNAEEQIFAKDDHIAEESVEPFELDVDEPTLEESHNEPDAAYFDSSKDDAIHETLEPVVRADESSKAPDEEILAEVSEEETVSSYSIPAATVADVYAIDKSVDADASRITSAKTDAYGDFNVTVIEEKNTGTRNKLLLGTFSLMIVSLFSGLVYSIFSKDLDVASINDDIFNAILVEEVPTVVEEAPKPKEAKKDAGGGGGGGREEREETTRGDLADQTKTPIRPPDAKIPRLDNPSLRLPPPSTEGDRKFPKQYDRWGDPNGRFDNFSNGTGSGGGQGSGRGTGQGSGRGTGAGSGIGSGSGSGLGSGNGDGTGSGGAGSPPPPPPPRPVGVTQNLRIISKPRPGYTDAARQNNIQGTVVLRVTFLASGAIGDISPVKGLPNGLTEQAIAAARRISFEPQKVDGVGKSITRQIEYTFSIY